MYGSPEQSMDNKFFIQIIFIIFKTSILGGTLSNRLHLLTLDGHGSHVNLKAIEHAQ
jgi:hypothetical protein